jgi:hypothetical protein
MSRGFYLIEFLLEAAIAHHSTRANLLGGTISLEVQNLSP